MALPEADNHCKDDNRYARQNPAQSGCAAEIELVCHAINLVPGLEPFINGRSNSYACGQANRGEHGNEERLSHFSVFLRDTHHKNIPRYTQLVCQVAS